MSKGIAIPIRTFRGRLVTEEGEKQIAKLVLMAVGDGESENPFNQDVGIQHPVFALDDAGTKAIIRSEIGKHFAKFSRDLKAKLISVTFETEKEGESTVNVKYRNIETDEESEAVKRVRRL